MILYTTEHCPQCSFLKQKLTDKNIKFQICTDEKILIEKGITFVPIIELDNGTQLNLAQALAALNKGELQ